jgi:hypothetical protein
LLVVPQNRWEDEDSVGHVSRSSCLLRLEASSAMVFVDISYAAPQAHIIINVALQLEYSPGIILYFPKGENTSIMSKINTRNNSS